MARDVAEVANQSFEAQIVRLEAERDARLTIDEARARMLDAIDGARQGCVTGNGWNGDLFRDLSERQMVEDGMQVVALPDFNAALDKAFPPADQQEGEHRG